MACGAQAPQGLSLGLKVPIWNTEAPKASPSHSPGPVQGRGCLLPRHPGGPAAPQQSRRSFPTRAGAPAGLWRPWHLREAGITSRNSLNASGKCVNNQSGACRPAARGQSPWCQIKDQAEGRGGPRYKLPPPEEPRGPGPAAPPGPDANWRRSRGQCRGQAALRRWPAGSPLCVQSSLRMRSAAPAPLGPGCFPSGDYHSGLGARLC